MSGSKHVIAIIGPTAVGKTTLSIQLAQHFQAEIISSDSRQMFRHMDIGTAKPSQAEQAGIPHHFIDSLDPDEEINAAEFAAKTEAIIARAHQHSDYVIIVGGSTLYMEALWFEFDMMPEVAVEVRVSLNNQWQKDGLEPLIQELADVDPETHASIDRKNPARVIRALEVYRASGKPISSFRKGRKPKKYPFEWIKIGLADDREALYQRIDQRVQEMIDAGLEIEVKKLLRMGYNPDSQALQSIGYKEMIAYLSGEIDHTECIRLIQRNSRRYAKRQLTWFRKYDDVQWFKPEEISQIVTWIKAKKS